MLQFTELLSTEEAQNGATDVANSVLETVTLVMKGDLMQLKIDQFVVDATRKCPQSPDYTLDASASNYEPSIFLRMNLIQPSSCYLELSLFY